MPRQKREKRLSKFNGEEITRKPRNSEIAKQRLVSVSELNILYEFSKASRRAAQRIVKIMETGDDFAARLAAKDIVQYFQPKERGGPAVVVNNQPQLVSYLGLPAAPGDVMPEMPVLEVERVSRGRKAIPKVLPEAAEAAGFSNEKTLSKRVEEVSKESFDVGKVTAPMPDFAHADVPFDPGVPQVMQAEVPQAVPRDMVPGVHKDMKA